MWDYIINLVERGDVRFSRGVSRCTVSSETVDFPPRTVLKIHVENSLPSI